MKSGSVSANFTATVNDLVQGTLYYYRAYATNSGGTAYGAEQTLLTRSIPSWFEVSPSPIHAGSEIHWSLKNIVPGHYQVKIFNWTGQQVFVRDLLIQVNFIDDRFYIPRNLTKGVYTFQVGKDDLKMNKTFMIL